MDALVGMMAGSFGSHAQAQADPEFRDIRLHMAPIWPNQKGARWMYVEQAAAEALEKPYRQRVYRVWSERDGQGERFISEVYELPGDPLAFAGAWHTPGKLDGVTPETLTKRDGCEVVLRRTAPGLYEGSTVDNRCASTLRGAAYATSKVRVEATGLTTWDQGFDANGVQVWGAVKGPYRFDRLPD
jgi:hypothetical protein